MATIDVTRVSEGVVHYTKDGVVNILPVAFIAKPSNNGGVYIVNNGNYLFEIFPTDTVSLNGIAFTYTTFGIDLAAQIETDITFLASSDKLKAGSVVTKTANYTATIYDNTILCDATTGAITIDLPTAVGNSGVKLNIKKIDSSVNIITIDANGSEKIDADLTKTIANQWTSITIISNGANWYII